MTPDERTAGFRALAADLDRIDREVYATYDRDPLQPIIGAGDRTARVCFFGRDPGRREVKYALPFIGAGGQKVRAVLHEVLEGRPMPDFEASLRVGERVFWANTVPYKPIKNKAWGRRVQRRFAPLMADLLVHDWAGSDVITLGRLALLWFGLLDRETLRRIEAFWAREDRFETSTEVELTAPDGTARTMRLHPLPHPSPLNVRYYAAFPGMLEARLRALGFGADAWPIEGGAGDGDV